MSVDARFDLALYVDNGQKKFHCSLNKLKLVRNAFENHSSVNVRAIDARARQNKINEVHEAKNAFVEK